MFFYLAHRLSLEIPAAHFGLRGVGDLMTTYVVAAAVLLMLYPACRWYRTHPRTILRVPVRQWGPRGITAPQSRIQPQKREV